MTHALRCLLTVLVAGVLLGQHLPIAMPAQTSGMHAAGDGHACTHRVCPCRQAGHSCAGDSCPRHAAPSHGPAEEAGAHAGDDDGEDASGAERARCSRSAPGPAPAAFFAVSKSLFAPVPGVAAATLPAPARVERREVFAPQQYTGQLFRPPRRRIG